MFLAVKAGYGSGWNVHTKIRVRIESDSLILKGILALFVMLFDNRTAAEIRGHRSTLIQETPLKEQLSTDRFRGIQSVIDAIKNFAKDHIK